MSKVYRILGTPNHARDVRRAMGQQHPGLVLCKMIATALLLPLWVVLMITFTVMLGGF